MNDFTISSNRHEIEFELILLITDLDHLINVFTNEMKLSNIASIIGTGIYGLLHLTVNDQFKCSPGLGMIRFVDPCIKDIWWWFHGHSLNSISIVGYYLVAQGLMDHLRKRLKLVPGRRICPYDIGRASRTNRKS